MRLFILAFTLCLLALSGRADTYLAVAIDSLEEPESTQQADTRTALQKRRDRLRQTGKSEARRRADELYERLGYLSSTDFYQQLDAADMNQEVLRHLANSYRLNSYFREAEYWYAQFIQQSDDPDDFLRYAQMLQVNEKCEKATEYFLQYYALSGDNHRYILQDCAELETIPALTGIEVRNMEEINSPLLEFSPVLNNEQLYFTSNRSTHRLQVNRDKWTKTDFTDLFVARLTENGRAKAPRAVSGDLNDRYHDGVPTFDRMGTRMIFTHSNRADKRRNTTRDLKLYTSEQVEGGFWTEPVEMPELNDDTYASAHPTLSEDGRKLYFSSDRPGGYGGMDLYVSERIGSKWTEPINMGPNVNTSGKEVFPFLAADGTPYFSSDGHLGLGSLDIYFVHAENADTQPAQNLGKPFNGIFDDFGFVSYPEKGGGYFTSNREGGLGGDDIYQWTGSLDQARTNSLQRRRLCLTDKVTGAPVEGATVTIIEVAAEGDIQPENGHEELLLTLKPLDASAREYVLSVMEKEKQGVLQRQQFTSDKKGEVRYSLQPDRNYLLLINKEGYTALRKTRAAAGLLEAQKTCFELEQRSCVTVKGSVTLRSYPMPIPEATVYLRTHCNDQVTVVTADEAGRFELCLPCDCEYYITGHKDRFVDGSTYLAAKDLNCAKVTGELAVQLELSMVEGMAAPAPRSYQDYPSGMGYPGQRPAYATPRWDPALGTPGRIPGSPSPDMLNRYFLGQPQPEYTAGQVIQLTNLYYDFDEHYIRADAGRELDYVYELLRRYPSMEINLESHTDSRGGNRYNQLLSQRRAEAATKYLINRGIAPYRVTFRGFGEALTVNECADGVECSEAAHQLNRRTEIRITRFDEPGVRVGGR